MFLNRFKHYIQFIFIFIAGMLLFACSFATFLTDPQAAATQTPEPSPTAALATFSDMIEAESSDIAVLTPVPTPTASPTPTPTPTPEPTPTPTPPGLIGGKYDVFEYGEPYRDVFTYKSDKVSITMDVFTENPFRNKKLVYFVADIYIQDLSSFRTKAAKDFENSRTGKITKISSAANAILAVNGDYYIHNNKNSLIVRNGVVYSTKAMKNRDILFLYRDGSIRVCTGSEYDSHMDFSNVWQAWQFGPYLLEEDGTPRTKFPGYGITPLNPRTAFGYYEPGHYCFVVVEGRRTKYSEGITMSNLAKLMASLGCKQAYNFDGGNSSQLYWDGRLYNVPSGGSLRSIPDILYIVDPYYITDLTDHEPNLMDLIASSSAEPVLTPDFSEDPDESSDPASDSTDLDTPSPEETPEDPVSETDIAPTPFYDDADPDTN